MVVVVVGVVVVSEVVGLVVGVESPHDAKLPSACALTSPLSSVAVASHSSIEEA